MDDDVKNSGSEDADARAGNVGPAASMDESAGSAATQVQAGVGAGDKERASARRFSNMVEVEFKEGTRAKVGVAPDGATFEFTSEEETLAADDINALLLEQGCSKAERVFDESPEEIAGEEASALAQGVSVPDLSGFYVLHFPEGANVHAIAKRLREYPGVKHADAVPLIAYPAVGRATIPDDEFLLPSPDRDHQWYIERCRVDKAWGLKYTGKGVVIALIDSGFQIQHPDLLDRFNLERAFNALTGDDQLSTCGGNLSHGTAVAGLAGAAANHKGLVGIAHGAELWPIEVSGHPSIYHCLWARAIRRVIKFIRTEPRRVVVIIEAQTFGGGNVTQIRSIKTAILSAIAYGAVVCIPAGNGNREVSEADCDDAETYPKPCHGELFQPVGILVGATMMDDTPYQFGDEGTNFGEAIVVTAPGDPNYDLTCSADLNSPFRSNFGATSGATPKVAGAVALMLEANGKLSQEDVADIFRHTGTPITSKPLGRLLDCEAAVQAAENYRVTASRPIPVRRKF